MTRSGSPADDPTPAVIGGFRNARFSAGVRCPRCSANRTLRWGTFRGRQRYRCPSCGRTFSDLTLTPAAYAKKLGLWPAYAALLADGVSVRRAAAILHIHPSTAFRWRHALLQALRDRDTERLEGWIEITSLRFAHSEKGARGLRRPARRRGRRVGDAREGPAVYVLVACDRVGHGITGSTGPRTHPPIRDSLDQLLAGRTGSRPTLVAEGGPYGVASRFARQRGGMFREARRGAIRRARTLDHIETASAYAARLRRWVLRFRGVATRYLANYLVWHRAIDGGWRHGIGRAALRWPVGDGVP